MFACNKIDFFVSEKEKYYVSQKNVFHLQKEPFLISESNFSTTKFGSIANSIILFVYIHHGGLKYL